MSVVLVLSVAMGLMLSPDTLILLGNSLGHAGLAFLGWMLLAALAMLCTARSYATVQTYFPGPAGESQCLRAAFGAIPAIVLPLCARLVFITCAGTGLLALAGYVFNEVFVYWFPNLGFSFYVLAGVLLLNLLGQRLAAWAQLVFVSVALVGLAGLVLVGLTGHGETLPSAASLPLTSPPLLYSAALSLWFFLGVELVTFLRPPQVARVAIVRMCMLLGIGLAVVLFWAWGWVSLSTLPRARLADISVPHMVTARALLGHTGRVLMGLVVLAGTCSAINAFLMAGARMLVGLATQGLLPSWVAWKAARAPLPLLLLAFGPAAMMYMGLAGEPETEVFARAGVVFWWVLYVAVQVALVRVLQRKRRLSPAQILTPALGSLLLGMGIVGVLWHDHDRTHMLAFMLIVTGGMTLASVAWLGWQRYKDQNATVVLDGSSE